MLEAKYYREMQLQYPSKLRRADNLAAICGPID
jgi:hypothetical protein